MKLHLPKIGLGLLIIMLLVAIGIAIYMRNKPVEDAWVFELQDATPAEPRKPDGIDTFYAAESPTDNVKTPESPDHDTDVDTSEPVTTDTTVGSEK